VANKTILVIVDLDADTQAGVLDRAAWLAGRYGADLTLFACDYDADIESGYVATVWIPQPGVRDQLLERHRQKLEALAEPLRKRGVSVTTEVAWDHPFDAAIVRKAASSKPLLVVKGTHHHNLLQRTLLTNVDWQLIRDCPTPLLLVKQQPLHDPPRVFAALDPLHEHDKPAELDDEIFRFAADFATRTRGVLHVLHAVPLPVGLDLPPDVTEGAVRRHREAMSSFLGRHEVEPERVHFVEGFVPQSLQETASEQGADFVVMGAVSRRGLQKLFIGSTAERVLDRLPCDLVIVKPQGFVTPDSETG
jgi:universal stress protein E